MPDVTNCIEAIFVSEKVPRTPVARRVRLTTKADDQEDWDDEDVGGAGRPEPHCPNEMLWGNIPTIRLDSPQTPERSPYHTYGSFLLDLERDREIER